MCVGRRICMIITVNLKLFVHAQKMWNLVLVMAAACAGSPNDFVLNPSLVLLANKVISYLILG